jgi:hypothetical protein
MSTVIDRIAESEDIEATESYLRENILQVGGRVMEIKLKSQATAIDKKNFGNKSIKYCGQRVRKLHTLMGEIKIERGYYLDIQTGKYVYPFDEEYRIGGSSYSPGALRAVSKLGAYLPYGFSDKEITELTGIDFGSKAVERITKEIGSEVMAYNDSKEKLMPPYSKTTKQTAYLAMDGTGIPMTKETLKGRKGKQTEEAKTREVKLGCIFTQTTTDADGYPIREEGSTTYLGGILSAKEFSEHIEIEAGQRLPTGAKNMCILGDGAAWIWNIADELFPEARQILDLYHAREHYWNVAKAFFPEGSRKQKSWAEKRKNELDEGKVNLVIRAITRLKPRTEEQKKVCKTERGYFIKHKGKMKYNEYRKMGLFVGSGVLEAGCKSLVGHRLKQSGMHWSIKGADAVIALRCCIFSNQWEDFWEKRAA